MSSYIKKRLLWAIIKSFLRTRNRVQAGKVIANVIQKKSLTEQIQSLLQQGKEHQNTIFSLQL